MTEQIELQKLVDELESPIGEMSQGIKLLEKLCDAFEDADVVDALAFVARGFGNSVDKLEKAHNALHHALRQDAPTPLHSV